MKVEHPLAGDGDGRPPSAVDVDGDSVPVDEGVFELPEGRESWLNRFAAAYDIEPEALVREEDGPPDEESGADDHGAENSSEAAVSFDPSDHTVDEIREHVESIDSSESVAELEAELEAIRDAEVEGKDRTTALEAIDSRLDNLTED